MFTSWALQTPYTCIQPKTHMYIHCNRRSQPGCIGSFPIKKEDVVFHFCVTFFSTEFSLDGVIVIVNISSCPSFENLTFDSIRTRHEATKELTWFTHYSINSAFGLHRYEKLPSFIFETLFYKSCYTVLT